MNKLHEICYTSRQGGFWYHLGRSQKSSATATAYERADQGILVLWKGSLIAFKACEQHSRAKSDIFSFSAATHTSMRMKNYLSFFGLAPTGTIL
jgi:hypothetical protein